MNIKTTLSILSLALAGLITAQQPITLEEIWKDYTFYAKSVPGFTFQNDGLHYTRREENKINQYDLTTGELTKTLFDAAQITGHPDFPEKIDGYTFSDDESKLLIRTATERVFRHSRQANYYIWDGKELVSLFSQGKQRDATFSPQADKVAFVHENNLYYKDLQNGNTIQVTKSGEYNKIINGAADWVYEEEFGFSKAFQWSPDGKKIAYYRFDESRVKEFTMTNYTNDLYPEYETFKYPKVGENNAVVTIHIYHLQDKSKIQADLGDDPDIYIPRIQWTQDPDKLCVFRMNRHQNELELLLVHAETGFVRRLIKEVNTYYIDIHDHLTFLKDGRHFIWVSELDKWNQIYLYGMDGKIERQLTEGEWDVSDFYGVDEKNGLVYYQAGKKSPTQRQVYSVSLDGGKNNQLTLGEGWNSAQFSSTFDYFVNTYSTINSPPTYTVYTRKAKKVRLIENNAKLLNLQRTYQVQPVEFFDFKTSDKVKLSGYMIKPPDFDPQKEYPVFMYLYGGPGSQKVVDDWQGQNYWWFQMLAQQGFIVACVDNRGTGARGEDFKKVTYLELGKYEAIDQIEAARFLGSLPFTDANRIGIYGWSYGGYMSSLCLLKGNDVFKAAIAVAPVTNWKWYDTIYTERYMRTEEENPEGYYENSPVNFADRLHGNYLLVHGMGDDNVHFQHTAEMANALIKANKQFDTYFYPNRAHGISGGLTRLHLYTRMTDFLMEKLMNDHHPVVKP